MKIAITKIAAISAVLDQVQAKSKVRNMTAIDIICHAKSCDEKLQKLGLSERDSAKAIALFGYEKFANAYKFSPEGTVVGLQRGATGWFMVQCSRRACNGRNRLTITDKQKELLTARLARQLRDL